MPRYLNNEIILEVRDFALARIVSFWYKCAVPAIEGKKERRHTELTLG